MAKRRGYGDAPSSSIPCWRLGPPSRNDLPAKWRGTLSQALREYERARWPHAIAILQSVIERTVRPGDSTQVPRVALWYRARAAVHAGDYDAAIRHLDWMLALRVADTTAREWNPFVGDELRYMLAFVNQQAGRWDTAITLYRGILERNLGLDPAHSHLAEIHEAQGRWQEAIEERRRAFHANPEEPVLHFDLGGTLAHVGQYAEAEQVLLTYSAAHPRESRLYYLLGFAQARLGRVDAARESLRRYLSLAPSRYAEQIADAKRRLAALGPGNGGTR